MTGIKVVNSKPLDNSKVILQTIERPNKEGIIHQEDRIILPHISDEELLKRYARIKPIVKVHQEFYYYLKDYDIDTLRYMSYLWFSEDDLEKRANMNSSEIITEFPCYHPYEFVGIFNPTISDILEQFPDDALNEANAFYLTDTDISRIHNHHHSLVRALRIKK